MNRLGEKLGLVELTETVDDVEDEEAPLVHSCRCGSLGSPTDLWEEEELFLGYDVQQHIIYNLMVELLVLFHRAVVYLQRLVVVQRRRGELEAGGRGVRHRQ
ncbi:hypothetical protein FQN60_013072, partial [Etheostoma spectabile]